MKLLLVRHGEPSYTPCTQRELKGQGRDLAALNDDGIHQILSVSVPKLVDRGVEIILSSPYTRSLQSAAIIASKLGLITKVVHDLHEWIPDLTFNYSSFKELKFIYSDFYEHKGIRKPPVLEPSELHWEELETFRNRVENALKPFCTVYDCVAVVSHGMVIQSLTGKTVGYGEVVEIEFDENFVWPQWVFKEP
ncbi:MAG TPA: histidine phosphatase family protein [Clostridiales bacterium UBA8960]|jgi:broad specificity phosphatase PhoE|nr:histidine phosphatase family protein [Clostridiales bacterium UBA8960]